MTPEDHAIFLHLADLLERLGKHTAAAWLRANLPQAAAPAVHSVSVGDGGQGADK